MKLPSKQLLVYLGIFVCLPGLRMALGVDIDPSTFPAVKQYSADMTTVSQIVTITNKIFVDNGKIRSEINMSDIKGMPALPGGQSMPPMKMIAILRPDQKKMYEVFTFQKLVMVMPFDPDRWPQFALAALFGKFELIGLDTVDGVACTKYKVRSEKMTLFVWLDATRRIPVKSMTEDGSIVVSFKNFHEGPQDPALFEPPSGYQVTQMPTFPGLPGAAPSTAGPSAADSTNAPDAQSVTASPVGNDGVSCEAIIGKVKAAYKGLQSYSDTGTVLTKGDGVSSNTNFKIRLQRPRFYRIDWEQPWPMGKAVVWSDGTGNYLRCPGITPEKQESMSMALAGATGISDGAAASIPETFFTDGCGVDLFRGDHQRKPDETVGGIDCYVILGVLQDNGQTDSTTLWIGKKDYLIHRLEDLMVSWPEEQPIEDSVMIATLKSRHQKVTSEAIAKLKQLFTVAQQASRDMLKSGPTEFTQEHLNIETDKVYTPADFKPDSQ